MGVFLRSVPLNQARSEIGRMQTRMDARRSRTPRQDNLALQSLFPPSDQCSPERHPVEFSSNRFPELDGVHSRTNARDDGWSSE